MRYVLPPRSMSSIWLLARRLFKEPEPQILHFNQSNFQILPTDQKIEEEAHDTTLRGRYYPARIGEVVENKYQIVGKLGYGLGSTVWLARDIRFVALQVTRV